MASRRGSDPSTTERILGELLYRGLFTGRVGSVMEQVLEESTLEPEGVMRLRLDLKPEPWEPRFSALPWELLHGPPGPDADFLAFRRDLRLSVGVSGTGAAGTQSLAGSVVRALVLDPASAPGRPSEALLADRPWGMSVRITDPFDRAALQDAATEIPDLVHVVGRFASLADEQPYSRSRHSWHPGLLMSPFDPERLLPVDDMLSRFDPVPALVVLEDREPGGTGARESAFALLQARLPRVLVVPAPSREASEAFLGTFYDALLGGVGIEDAVSRGRRADLAALRGTPLGGTMGVSLWVAGEPNAKILG